MPIYQDESDLPDVGPIVAAFLDERGCTIVGEFGTAEIPRPTTVIDLGEGPPALRVVPVNAGAAHSDRVGEGDPMWSDRPEPEPGEERLTFSEIVAMMRHPIPLGAHGGSNGGGRAKPMLPAKFHIAAPDDDDDPKVKARLRERVYAIRGLSPGVAEFYTRRHGLDVEVLRALAARIARPGFTPDWEPLPKVTRLTTREVGGLHEDEILILKAYPGAAARELTRYARAEDPTRVEAIDRGAGAK